MRLSLRLPLRALGRGNVRQLPKIGERERFGQQMTQRTATKKSKTADIDGARKKKPRNFRVYLDACVPVIRCMVVVLGGNGERERQQVLPLNEWQYTLWLMHSARRSSSYAEFLAMLVPTLLLCLVIMLRTDCR